MLDVKDDGMGVENKKRLCCVECDVSHLMLYSSITVAEMNDTEYVHVHGARKTYSAMSYERYSRRMTLQTNESTSTQ